MGTQLNPYRVAAARGLIKWARDLRIANQAAHIPGWRKHVAEKLNMAAEECRNAWQPWDYAYEISVCQCCMLSHANGECCPDHTEECEFMPLAKIDTVAHSVAMGGEHRDNCTEEDHAEGCDCEDLGFSWGSCEGCGSPYGGDRYRMTVFVNDRRN